MPLPPPRRRSPRPLVLTAVAAGVVAVVVAATVVVGDLVKGDRPEEAVARAYLEAVFDGDVDTAYGLTTPGFRAVVFPDDLGALAAGLRELAGPAVTVDVLGSERTPGADPPQAFVGYTGRTRVGEVRGVAVLVELEPGTWRVRGDVSYRFPDAPPGATDELDELIGELNDQVATRVSQGSG